MSEAVLNALTIDVEDYYMVSAFEPSVPKSDWGKYESRVVGNTERVLSLLDETGVRATFFTLGWIGERFPELVRRVARAGHEVACHGYDHQLLYNMTQDQFRQDVRRAKKILEDACGAPVLGYRAPSFSVVASTRWALHILAEEGFKYDSSVLPARHARGGLAGAERFPHRLNGLVEFPMSTMRVAGTTLPFSGGGYFRLFPYGLVASGLRECNRQGRPAITYLHPWEFDPEQPRMPGRWFDRFKHYANLGRTAGKLKRLIGDFRFGTAREVLAGLGLHV